MQPASADGSVTGKDLADDHPVGITFPITGARATDFNQPAGVRPDLVFHDSTATPAPTATRRACTTPAPARRLSAPPAMIPAAGAGSQFLPTFLQVTNENSTLCRTCHDI